MICVTAVSGLVVAYSLLNPTPPRTVVMSTGPVGSAYEDYAEQYREHFAENGIELELRASGGAKDNLGRLHEPTSDVGVAFITMGTPDSVESAGVESLGAMFHEPLWVFTSDDDLANGALLSIAEMQISIGPLGSRSNVAARGLFKLLGLEPDQLQLLALNPADAAKQLMAGSIDTAIFVTNAATPIVKDLLSQEDVVLVNFRRADAYTALYPALKKLKVPAGVGSLAKDLPPNDVNILAFTALLAVREDLHPAIQSLLLDAANQIHAKPDLFHADGGFPSATVYRIPLSATASHYYTSGQPFLQRFLPFWLAVLVMQILVAAIPLIGIVYPALKLMPSAFDWAMQRRIDHLYRELRLLEMQLTEQSNEPNSADLNERLADLEGRVRNLKVPLTYSSRLFALRSHINVVRARIRAE